MQGIGGFIFSCIFAYSFAIASLVTVLGGTILYAVGKVTGAKLLVLWIVSFIVSFVFFYFFLAWAWNNAVM